MEQREDSALAPFLQQLQPMTTDLVACLYFCQGWWCWRS